MSFRRFPLLLFCLLLPSSLLSGDLKKYILIGILLQNNWFSVQLQCIYSDGYPSSCPKYFSHLNHEFPKIRISLDSWHIWDALVKIKTSVIASLWSDIYLLPIYRNFKGKTSSYKVIQSRIKCSSIFQLDFNLITRVYSWNQTRVDPMMFIFRCLLGFSDKKSSVRKVCSRWPFIVVMIVYTAK